MNEGNPNLDPGEAVSVQDSRKAGWLAPIAVTAIVLGSLQILCTGQMMMSAPMMELQKVMMQEIQKAVPAGAPAPPPAFSDLMARMFDVPAWTKVCMTIGGSLGFILSILLITAGAGMLKRRLWARSLAIWYSFAMFVVVVFLIGTAVSSFSIMVMGQIFNVLVLVVFPVILLVFLLPVESKKAFS